MVTSIKFNEWTVKQKNKMLTKYMAVRLRKAIQYKNTTSDNRAVLYTFLCLTGTNISLYETLTHMISVFKHLSLSYKCTHIV